LKKEKERKKEKEEEKEKLQESQQIKGKSIFWEEKNTSTSKFLWRGEIIEKVFLTLLDHHLAWQYTREVHIFSL
jgi:hypothetical protein